MGIEIVPEYLEKSRELAKRYMEREDLQRSIGRWSTVGPEELLVKGDIFRDVDWSDASIVFCNAVTWPLPVIGELANFALRLRTGAVFMLLGLARSFPPDPQVLA